MASQAEICNRALTKLGAARITDVLENSKSARAMNALWDTVRKAELRRRIWQFATTRTTLPAVSPAPAWGFNNAFQLPSDFLRLVQVNDTFAVPGLTDYRDQDDSAYVIENNQILTVFNAPLKIRYIQNVTEPGRFDPLFVEMLASKLAYEACEEITQSTSKKQAAKDDYKEALREAVATGAVERVPQGFPDDSWMLIRI
ncbi:gp11 [Caballeronia peredens]|nr:gp11 [Caballeronia peredens]